MGRRVSLRLRLTAAFVVGTALVLALTGIFVVDRLRAELSSSIDSGLRSRARDLVALVRESDSGLREAGRERLEAGDVAQVIDARGRVLDATAAASGRPLLTGPRLVAARRSGLLVRRMVLPRTDRPYRVLAVPVRAQDQRLVVVAAAPLRASDEAVSRLTALLAIGGPLALLLVGAAGRAVATAALRPVEALRRRAAHLAAEQTGEALPAVAGRDEVDRLEATLDGLLDRVDRARARERGFVADASHELLTPLTVLHAHLELGAEAPAEAQREALLAGWEETSRLIRLARDLLVLARSDRGTLPVERASVPVAALLADVAARAMPAATRAARPIVVDATHGLEVSADRLRLEQALGNLVDNALRHGAGPVRLGSERVNGLVELHVRDAGPGFPDDFRPRAFERFARADGATTDGSGLGLAIVAAIARAHGGAAHAANAPGGGADVWIALPDRQ